MIQFLLEKRSYQLTIFFLVVFFLSILSTVSIPTEIMPQEAAEKFLFVQVKSAIKRTPLQNESALTLPLEGILRTLPSLKSFSTQTTGSRVSMSLTYNADTDMKLAEVLLREGLQKLANNKLIEMKDVNVSNVNPDSPAVMKLSLARSVPEFPVSYLKTEFKKKLESVQGISKVELQGLHRKTISYSIPVEILAQMNLGNKELGAVFKFEDWRASIGSLQLGGHEQLAISARQVTNTIEEIRKQPLASGSNVTLSSVAQEVQKNPEDDTIVHSNGQRAIFAEIYAKQGANLFQLNSEVNQFLKSRDGPESKGLIVKTVFNRVDQLEMAIENVFLALSQSIAITAIVVFFFLRQLRTTLIIASAIPLSLFLTVAIMYCYGSSLNLLTLSGLILSIGLVVDNAIVVVERVMQDRGKQSLYGVATAAGELAPALFMSTLTTIIIFLPPAFVEGGDTFTDLIKAFQVPIISSLMASYLLAVFFLPLVCFKFLASPSGGQERAGPHRLSWLKTYRKPVFVSSLLIIALNLWYVSDIKEKSIDIPRDPYSQLRVKFSKEVPAETRLKWFRSIESKLLDAKSSMGYEFVLSDFNSISESGQISVFVKSSLEMDEKLKHLDAKIDDFVQTLESKPGLLVTTGYLSSGSRLKSKKMRVRLQGLKMSELKSYESKLMKSLSQLAGVQSVRSDAEEKGKKSLIFEPDAAAIASMGISKKDLARALRSLTRSFGADNVNKGQETVQAKIYIGKVAKDRDMASLKNVQLNFGKNKKASLNQLGYFRETPRDLSFRRKDAKVKSQIYVHFKDETSSSQLRSLKSEVRKIAGAYPFPSGYGIPKISQNSSLAETQKKSEFIIYLSGFLIFLILASLFESLLLPVTIMLTVPLSLFFGITGLKLLGMPLDVMARLSLMILVGIGVNNAIVLVDVIERQRRRGLPLLDAIQTGCESRIKSVTMSTATTVLGVLPIAVGHSQLLGLPFASLGICIMSGMMFSTIVTIGVLPVMVELSYKIRRSFFERTSR